MSKSVDALNEALKSASNPVNPPPARPIALNMSGPASSLDPSFAGHWHNNNQFTPPNTATETHGAHWYPSSPQMDHTPVSQAPMDGTWPVDQTSGRVHQHNQPQGFFEADADFHQQAIAFSGTSQIHDQNEYPNPPHAHTTYAGDAPQSKAPAVDDLFSDIDENEMPDSDETDQDDNIFHMSGFGQQETQNPIQQESNTSLQSISRLSQTPNNVTLIDIRDFEDPGSHPSPTESQLIAEGFEFHNQLPEEIQISRFNDKAVRKALREVQSDLPRKQQWYAWSKAKQMLNSEPKSAVTKQMPNRWGEPLEWQYEYQLQNDTEMPQEKHTASEQIEDGIWGPPIQPISLGTTTHGRSGSAGEEDHAIGRQWVAQPFEVRTLSSPASIGGFAIGQGDWHASKEAADRDRLSAKPFGSIIKKIAEGQQTRKASKDEVPEVDQGRLSSKPLGSLIKKIAEEQQARRASEDEVPLLDQGRLSRLSASPLGALKKRIATEQLARRDSKDEDSILDQDRLSTQPLGPLIKKIANEQRSRRDSEDNEQPNDAMQVSNRYDQLKIADAMTAKLLWRRDGSAHGLLSYGNGSEQEMTDLKDSSPSQTQTHLPPPLPLRMNEQLTSNSYNHSHDPNLLHPHHSTTLHRSPSSSHSYTHIPPPRSLNRRSPSPWIEHPGINRPDTPRPIPGESSPLRERDGIRVPIQPETPLSSRVRERERTPSYTSRSPSPSPVSHLGISHTHANARQHDVNMTDAPSPFPSPPPVPRIPTQHLPQKSSPDPPSSPLVCGGNTVTAPQTPLPDIASIKQPKRFDKSRRKSVGGQTSKPEKFRAVTKSAAGVQGSNINKSRNVTRKVTQAAQNVTANAKKEGSKVAQAVKKIEEGIKAADGSPRRSGRIAAKKGGK